MSDFKRRIRIKCDPQYPVSHSVEIEDLSTGKAITNVKEAKIYLKAGDVNRAELTCVKMDSNKPAREIIEAEVPEIDLAAFEPWNRNDIRDLLVDALIVHGSHHKQWYLWQLVDLLGYALDIDADRGIAP